MKKLLSILGAFGLTLTGVTSVVACDNENAPDIKNGELAEFTKEKITNYINNFNKDVDWNMSTAEKRVKFDQQYFEMLDNNGYKKSLFNIAGFKKEWLAHNESKLKMHQWNGYELRNFFLIMSKAQENPTDLNKKILNYSEDEAKFMFRKNDFNIVNKTKFKSEVDKYLSNQKLFEILKEIFHLPKIEIDGLAGNTQFEKLVQNEIGYHISINVAKEALNEAFFAQKIGTDNSIKLPVTLKSRYNMETKPFEIKLPITFLSGLNADKKAILNFYKTDIDPMEANSVELTTELPRDIKQGTKIQREKFYASVNNQFSQQKMFKYSGGQIQANYEVMEFAKDEKRWSMPEVKALKHLIKVLDVNKPDTKTHFISFALNQNDLSSLSVNAVAQKLAKVDDLTVNNQRDGFDTVVMDIRNNFWDILNHEGYAYFDFISNFTNNTPIKVINNIATYEVEYSVISSKEFATTTPETIIKLKKNVQIVFA